MGGRYRNRRRRGIRENPELDITTFLNLMVILIPFLLISAVFSRVTILELSVPTAGTGGSAIEKPNYTIEVIVRKTGLELGNGAQVVAAMPNIDEQYDLEKLTAMLMRLKKDYPQKNDATVLMEPDIEYETLIQIMDRVRETEVPDEESEEAEKLVLFPLISIGDAP
ncbi:biopolymer transporter ExbD [uncultured Desulfuromusa sp.]|uniref:ExbD/TolR family protein n=1 Tax=uncultured Desulfuromusa sp. TaxID=219183 RepID=UPI002AA818F8|nr:biopolymer transporter ExbD [uncultured Desulfuromusa sp.]